MFKASETVKFTKEFDSKIDTMATNAIYPKAEYGLLQAAYLALQCNPVGVWYNLANIAVSLLTIMS